MRTLLRRVQWTAAAIGAAVLATYLFPLVATVLAVALYSSWALIAVVLLRALPVPEWVRATLAALPGHLQRAAAVVGPWSSPTLGWSWRRRVGGVRARSLPPARLWPDLGPDHGTGRARDVD